MRDESGDAVGEAIDWPFGLPPLVFTEPLKGGFICRTTRGRLADGREAVVKRCPYPAEVEADGLRALADAGAPVPAVLGVAGHVLVLERVGGPPDWPALGRAIAVLHRTTGDRFGWHRDNFQGMTTQPNGWSDDWPSFYVERRVRAHLADPRVPERLRRQRPVAGPLQPPTQRLGDPRVGQVGPHSPLDVERRPVVAPAVVLHGHPLEVVPVPAEAAPGPAVQGGDGPAQGRPVRRAADVLQHQDVAGGPQDGRHRGAGGGQRRQAVGLHLGRVGAALDDHLPPVGQAASGRAADEAAAERPRRGERGQAGRPVDALAGPGAARVAHRSLRLGSAAAGQRAGGSMATVRPPSCMEVMTASATAPAISPSWAVARGGGRPAATASTQACSSRR